MHFSRPAFLIAAALIAATTGGVNARPTPKPRFTVGFIPNPVDATVALAINSSGRVVGAQGGVGVLFATPNNLALPRLGWSASGAFAINDPGQMAGYAQFDRAGTFHAVLWPDTHSALVDIGVSFPREDTQAWALNASGQVAGVVGQHDGFFYADGSVQRISNLTPQGLGQDGTIGGRTYDSAQVQHAATWKAGPITRLSELPGTITSTAVAINDLGEIAGWCADRKGIHPVIWKAGTLTRLSKTHSDDFTPYALNNHDQVVGERSSKAVLWQNGKLYDLNKALPHRYTWTLGTATGINDLGQICGYTSFVNPPLSHHVAFVLTPAR
jgi:uncharacterized membrane protein